WLLLGVAAIALTVIALVLTPPPAPPALTPAQHAESRQHVREIKDQVKEIQQAARTHRAEPFRLTANQNDLNELLTNDAETQQMLSSNGVEGAYAVVEDGQVRVTASVAAGGVPVSLTATLVPELD